MSTREPEGVVEGAVEVGGMGGVEERLRQHPGELGGSQGVAEIF